MFWRISVCRSVGSGIRRVGSGIKSHGIRDQKPWDQGSKAMGSGIKSHGIRDHKPWDQGSKVMRSGIKSHGIRDHKPWDQGSQAMGSGIKSHGIRDQGSGIRLYFLWDQRNTKAWISDLGIRSPVHYHSLSYSTLNNKSHREQNSKATKAWSYEEKKLSLGSEHSIHAKLLIFWFVKEHC